MPKAESTRFAVSPSLTARMSGMPPATAASKPSMTRLRRAASKISGPWWASSALLAVTTCLPASRALRMKVRAGSSPPTSSMTIWTAGSSSTRPAPRADPTRLTSHPSPPPHQRDDDLARGVVEPPRGVRDERETLEVQPLARARHVGVSDGVQGKPAPGALPHLGAVGLEDLDDAAADRAEAEEADLDLVHANLDFDPKGPVSRRRPLRVGAVSGLRGS